MLLGEMAILITMYKMYEHIENSLDIPYTSHFFVNYY